MRPAYNDLGTNDTGCPEQMTTDRVRGQSSKPDNNSQLCMGDICSDPVQNPGCGNTDATLLTKDSQTVVGTYTIECRNLIFYIGDVKNLIFSDSWSLKSKIAASRLRSASFGGPILRRLVTRR